MTATNGTNGILKFWPIIVATLLLAVGYGTNGTRLLHAEETIKLHEERIQEVEKALGDINTTLATVVANQENFKGAMSDIKELVITLVEHNGE